MALEVAEHGVRVNAVNPGVIITPVFKNAGINNLTKNLDLHIVRNNRNFEQNLIINNLLRALLFN